MLASLNLQLLSATHSLEGPNDAASIGVNRSLEAAAQPRPFASFLSVRSESLPIQPNAGGDFLPVDGKPLPPIAPLDVRPRLLQDLNPLKIEIPVVDSSVDQQLQISGDNERFVDLSVSLILQTPDAVAPEINLDSDLDFDNSYAPAGLVETTSPAVKPLATGLLTELSVAPASKQPLANRQPLADQQPAPDFSRPLHAERETGTPVRPAPTLDPAISAALSIETDKLRVPVTEPVAVLPAAEMPVREKVRPPQAPIVRAAINATDAPLPLDDVRAESALPNPGRVVSALESMPLPDTRVAGVSSSHSPAATLVPGHTTALGLEPTSGRPEMLTDTIRTSVRDNAWGEKLGERVLMMTGKQLQTAEIRLTPADLGPVRVRVSVEEGAAHVSFHAQHAMTREAIEQALPRLREMLSESGLSLGQTDVSERGVADQRDDQAFSSNASKESQDEMTETAMESEQSERRKTVTSSNLLDTFA